MAKFIYLINLDEIKALRITCGKCYSYWSVPIEPIGNDPSPTRCIYCKAEMPQRDITGLTQKLNHIRTFLKSWEVSIELEIEEKEEIDT